MKGLTFEAAQAGAPLSDEQRAAMREAIATLEQEPQMMGIAGDCGAPLPWTLAPCDS